MLADCEAAKSCNPPPVHSVPGEVFFADLVIDGENPERAPQSKNRFCRSSEDVFLTDRAGEGHVKWGALEKLSAWTFDPARMHDGLAESHLLDALGKEARLLLGPLHQIEPDTWAQNSQWKGRKAPAGSDVEDPNGRISWKNLKSSQARENLELDNAVDGRSGDKIDCFILGTKELKELPHFLFPSFRRTPLPFHERSELAP